MKRENISVRSRKTQAPRRRSDIWAEWRRHLVAQRASGQTQVAYCREHGLDPQYFCVWKRKLMDAPEESAEANLSAGAATGLQLVPLVIKADAAGESGSTGALLIHLKLSNGLSVSIEVSAIDALRRVLAELARASC